MTYGVLLFLATLAGTWVLGDELRRRSLGGPAEAFRLIPLVLLPAFFGAKLAGIPDEWASFSRDPYGFMLSPDGHSSWGAFLVGALAMLAASRRLRLPWRSLLDALAPAFLVGYGIGRIGCHVTGDGCYGLPIESDFVASLVGCRYPHGLVPTNALVWPTPLFESLFALMAYVWFFRHREGLVPGRLFAMYLVVHWGFRLGIETLRHNPRHGGLSGASWFSLTMVTCGLIWLAADLRRRRGPIRLAGTPR